MKKLVLSILLTLLLFVGAANTGFASESDELISTNINQPIETFSIGGDPGTGGSGG
jgi:hypothetical protein